MTTTTSVACPSWCRTDHAAEAREWAQIQADTEAYLRAPEHAAEMRHAFGEGWTPPAEDREYVMHETPMHRQEVGRIHVEGKGGMVPVRVLVDQAGSDEPPMVTVLVRDALYEDGYTPDEARALAALLVVAARVLEA